MPMINPFATDAFDMVALTAAINKIPNMYGRLEQLSLMPPQGVRLRMHRGGEKGVVRRPDLATGGMDGPRYRVPVQLGSEAGEPTPPPRERRDHDAR